jgi:molybdate transport system substrate-binding protein
LEEIVNRKFTAAISIASVIFLFTAGFLILAARRTPAQTPELHALVSDGMKPVIEEMTPAIEKAIGRKLVTQFNSSKNLRDKIAAGEQFDATVITSEVLDGLMKDGKITAASHREISRTGMGVGVRAGAPKPDISTSEALKSTLLKAKTVSFNPTGASASHIYDMFARMGITNAMKSKLVLDAEPGQPQRNVADGKVELVLSLIPEVKFFPGVDLVGPVPADFQSYISFSVGVSANAKDAAGAKSLVDFLGGATLPPVLKTKGMEPPAK